MDEQISYKAQELLNSFKKAESKWTEEINQKNDFIRRRDHTIATQIDTINSVSKEVLDLTLKNKKLEDTSKELVSKLNTEQTEQQKLMAEKVLLTRKCIEASKELETWKIKYKKLKSSWKEECKRRSETFSDDENSTSNAPKKMARSN